MRLRKIAALLSTLCLMAMSICQLPAHADAKRRVAILPFEYGAVSSHVGTVDVGKGITSLMITKLVNDGTYRVVDRQMLDQILKEQNLSVSDRADPATAIKIGKILACDAIIVGTVTAFGFENSSMNVGGAVSSASSYIPYVGGLGALGGLSVKKSKVKVAIDARIIDTATTEILGVAEGQGQSKRSGASLWGGSGWSGGGMDWGSDGFASSIAGEATYAAVDQLATQCVALAAKIPDNQSIASMDVKGKVADVTGDQVIINVGKVNGLNAGDSMQVDRPYKTIKDPETGKVLKELTATVGVITLKQVDNDNSTCAVVRGSGIKVGDSVRKVTTDVSAVVLTPLTEATTSAPKTVVNTSTAAAAKKPATK
jgi:curli biogenesis system outer membrane secretion channel CsgG